MIIAETENNVESNVKAAEHLSKSAKLTLLICGLILFAVGFAWLMLELYVFKDQDYFLPIFLMVFGIFFFVFSFFYVKVLRKTTKKLMDGKETHNVFRFTEEGYEIESIMNDGTKSSTYGNYSAFTECKEYPDMWLLYLNRATMFMVSKSGIKEGSVEELTCLLVQKLGGKYKNYNKKK